MQNLGGQTKIIMVFSELAYMLLSTPRLDITLKDCVTPGDWGGGRLIEITTLTHTEITLTASWITDPLLHELIIMIVQPWRTVPLVAFYFSPSHGIVRAVTAMNRTMLAKFCYQFCCPPLQFLPWFICERYVEPNKGIPNF